MTTAASFGFRICGNSFFAGSGISPVDRAISLLYDCEASNNSRVWPVGAVSMTTISSSDLAMTSANARKTAISSVHGDSKSSFT